MYHFHHQYLRAATQTWKNFGLNSSSSPAFIKKRFDADQIYLIDRIIYLYFFPSMPTRHLRVWKARNRKAQTRKSFLTSLEKQAKEQVASRKFLRKQSILINWKQCLT